ncbi:flagellar protein FlaG [Acidihalobacter aeolianus]|uniref:flagellar protein FlaG n=1 Tax=Acidihalobacter aeolianus TaxID=2792603 RepID=UPI0009F41F3F|nr:flagellar protein FlaG [Acidihalobacter aeolianus]
MNQVTNDLALLVTGGQQATGTVTAPGNTGQVAQQSGAVASGNTSPPAQSLSGKLQPAEINKALVQVNDYLQQQSRTLQFSIDQTTHQTIIKVVDQSTGQVLRQIPPESMVILAQRLQEMQHMESTGVVVKT